MRELMGVDSDSRARGFAICTTPRSGSNLFSQFLTSTGVLGRPLRARTWWTSHRPQSMPSRSSSDCQERHR